MKNKNVFFDLSEGMENSKKSGKSRGISRWIACDSSGNTND